MSLSFHFRCLAIASVLSAGGPLLAGPAERGPMPHLVDLYGDPLPEGAVARLGSVRLRHAGLTDFALLADGKTAATVGDNGMVYRWDLASGRRLSAVRLPAEMVSYNMAISGDGKLVAGDRWGQLSIADAATGKVLATTKTSEEFMDCLALSPDGSLILTGFDGYQVTLLDWKRSKSKTIQLAENKERTGHRPFLRAAFSKDGSRVLVYGIDGEKGLSVIEIATGRQLYSPPGRVEFAAISPDGSQVAACVFDGNRRGVRSAIQVHDIATGKVVTLQPDGLDPEWFEVSYTPDGKSVACLGKHRGCLVEVKTGRVLRALPTHFERPRFSTDGKRWAVGCFDRLLVWDSETGCPLQDEPLTFWNDLAVSPDGRRLALKDFEMPPAIDLWDTAAGRVVRRFPLPENHYKFDDLVFSRDGGALHTVEFGGICRSWMVDSGRAEKPVALWVADDVLGPYHSFRLSPDSKKVASIIPAASEEEGPARLDVWDIAGGQVIHRRRLDLHEWASIETWLADGLRIAVRVEGGVAFVNPETGELGPRVAAKDRIVFSSDGRMFAAWGEGPGETGWVRVWEVASGRVVALVPTRQTVRPRFDLALTSRAVVIAEGRFLRVIDLATGQERGRRALPDLGYLADPLVDQLNVLGSNQQVLTGLRDGTALVWDLSAFPPPSLADKHGEPELRAWWDELAGDDAATAYAAGWKLSEAPAGEVVAFLRERLRPARGVDRDDARKLIADLDSPVFAAREAASRRLQQMGPAMLPYLRHPPAGMSAEAGERLQVLVRRLSDPVPPAETLRVLRAVAVLERAGTDDARKVLDELSHGTADAPETKAARSALGRLWRGWNR